MTRLYCDGPTLLRAVGSAVENLAYHVDEVDSLNVFPVPDGDTGSNMLATMEAALAEATKLPQDEQSLRNVAAALSRGALTGARGNSGVILSQIIRGMTDGTDGRRRATGLDLAQGLRRGSDVAYGSVLMPVEGTILTVIRDAADAAESAAGKQPHVESVLADTIEAAARSVQRTPTLLPVLEDAGVVDSGGQGLFRLLEGTMQLDVAPAPVSSTPTPPETPLAAPIQANADDHHGQHGYETEFVISADGQPLDLEAIRAELQGVGESIIVAGDEQLARVHVHGRRPDLAIGIGVRWGRLVDVEVKDLDAQVTGSPLGAASASAEPDATIGSVLIAVADAEGLDAALSGLGARVVRPAHGSRPSVGEIAGAILATGAAQVVVLPNDRDAHLAAGQAASLTPAVAVSVIPTRNAAEGVAAAMVFDAGADLTHNTELMETEASSLRSFTVTTAARDSVVDGFDIQAGQIIALDADRRLLARGDSIVSTTLTALASMPHYELVTCYRGSSFDEVEGSDLMRQIGEQSPDAEVEVVPGGQRFDHLLVAVE